MNEATGRSAARLPVAAVAALAAALALLRCRSFVLAGWKRIYPHVPLLFVLAVPCLLAFALLIWTDLILVVAAADLIVLLLAAADLGTLPALAGVHGGTRSHADRLLAGSAPRHVGDHEPVAADVRGGAARRRAAGIHGRARRLRRASDRPQPRDHALRLPSVAPRGLCAGVGLPPRAQPVRPVAPQLAVPRRFGNPRLSGHEAAVRVRGLGAHQPAQPDGRAPDAARRTGQRIRTAPRLSVGTTTTSTSTGGPRLGAGS